jgi:hypothetical protein
MKRKLFLLILLTFILGISNIAAQERYLKPIDEGTQNTSFSKFRSKLISAVKNKDKKYLISILDSQIEVSFGGDNGIQDFKKFWEIDKANSEIWEELLLVLNNGGTFIQEKGKRTEQFCAPYTFTSFPEDLDAFEYNVIFGNNVRLRANPNLSSNTITKLSYNIVKIDFENSVQDSKSDGRFTWYKIETLGGLKGFVSADYVRSPIAYRACFEKKKGVWKMTAFIAGD